MLSPQISSNSPIRSRKPPLLMEKWQQSKLQQELMLRSRAFVYSTSQQSCGVWCTSTCLLARSVTGRSPIIDANAAETEPYSSQVTLFIVTLYPPIGIKTFERWMAEKVGTSQYVDHQPQVRYRSLRSPWDVTGKISKGTSNIGGTMIYWI